MSDLLIDIGNTRIKWARLEQGTLQPQSALPHADWTAQTFVDTLGPACVDARRVLVSNVAGPRMVQVIRAGLAQAQQVEPEFVTSTVAAGGVRNAYSQPAQLGVDRWLAIIGAHALERGAVCVVSVGTAMTIDGVDANGRHLGGVARLALRLGRGALHLADANANRRGTSRSGRSPRRLWQRNPADAARQVDGDDRR